MARQEKGVILARLISPWNAVAIVVGLLFFVLGISMLTIGTDASAVIIGIVPILCGCYVLSVGAFCRVAIRVDGMSVRMTPFKSEFVSWERIESVDLKESDYFIVRFTVPVLTVKGGDGSSISLRQIGYYRFRRGSESGQVRKLRQHLVNAR
jgi:hypothetical protein